MTNTTLVVCNCALFVICLADGQIHRSDSDVILVVCLASHLLRGVSAGGNILHGALATRKKTTPTCYS